MACMAAAATCGLWMWTNAPPHTAQRVYMRAAVYSGAFFFSFHFFTIVRITYSSFRMAAYLMPAPLVSVRNRQPYACECGCNK